MGLITEVLVAAKIIQEFKVPIWVTSETGAKIQEAVAKDCWQRQEIVGNRE
jgi:hypothetical protein